jgi:hypothetical protein
LESGFPYFRRRHSVAPSTQQSSQVNIKPDFPPTYKELFDKNEKNNKTSASPSVFVVSKGNDDRQSVNDSSIPPEYINETV